MYYYHPIKCHQNPTITIGIFMLILTLTDSWTRGRHSLYWIIKARNRWKIWLVARLVTTMVVGVVIVYEIVAIIINAVMSSCFYGNKTSFNAGTCYKFNIKDFCLFSSIFLFLVLVHLLFRCCSLLISMFSVRVF